MTASRRRVGLKHASEQSAPVAGIALSGESGPAFHANAYAHFEQVISLPVVKCAFSLVRNRDAGSAILSMRLCGRGVRLPSSEIVGRPPE